MTTADDPLVRFFFAAVPDAGTRAQLAAAADALHLDPARRVPCENYHVTFAFVGAVAAPRVATVRELGRARRCEKFSLRFAAYEYWPKPEVVVAAARAIPAPLERLWIELHRDLAEHRWAMAPKRLRPHVTLARKVVQAPVLPAMSAVDWPVSEFALMRSDIRGAQPAYTVVDTWPLLDSATET